MTSIVGNVDRYLIEVTLSKIPNPTIHVSNSTMRFVIQSLANGTLHWLSELAKTQSLKIHFPVSW